MLDTRLLSHFADAVERAAADSAITFEEVCGLSDDHGLSLGEASEALDLLIANGRLSRVHVDEDGNEVSEEEVARQLIASLGFGPRYRVVWRPGGEGYLLA